MHILLHRRSTMQATRFEIMAPLEGLHRGVAHNTCGMFKSNIIDKCTLLAQSKAMSDSS